MVNKSRSPSLSVAVVSSSMNFMFTGEFLLFDRLGFAVLRDLQAGSYVPHLATIVACCLSKSAHLFTVISAATMMTRIFLTLVLGHDLAHGWLRSFEFFRFAYCRFHSLCNLNKVSFLSSDNRRFCILSHLSPRTKQS